MSNWTKHEDWIDPKLDLVGVEGNGFYIVATVRMELRRAGNSDAVLEAYSLEATSGDYYHLVAVSMDYAGMLS
jgi:hypothetical protein